MTAVAARKVAILVLVEIIPGEGFTEHEGLHGGYEKVVLAAVERGVRDVSIGRPWRLHRVVQAVAP